MIVDAGNIKFQLYNTLLSYFNALSATGYVNYENVNHIILLSYIEEFINTCINRHLTLDDYEIINNVLYCIYGRTCFIGYPDGNRVIYDTANKPTLCFKQ